ncbi:MAG TPA: DUF2516 family protein [Marmoricola sp.]|nr:DUF2516 family protein [Marmoricola sp.]
MVHLFYIQNGVLTLVYFALFAVKVWALIDAIMRPAAAFPAADKLTKTAWLWITGLAFVAHMFSSMVGILSLLGTVAAFVYLLDVKPALASVTRRR